MGAKQDQKQKQMWAPSWLEDLLSTTFFTICSKHRDSARNECNMFCLDCKDDSFCFCCKSSSHKDHTVIQIRRSSYHDVVRVDEIQKVSDISGIQTYVINSARVLFLNERPQPKTSASKGSVVSHYLCEICARNLLDPFRFCSLGCKLVGMKRNGNTNFNSRNKEGETEEMKETRMVRRLQLTEEVEEGLLEGIEQDMNNSKQAPSPSANHPNGRRRSRRKGIPQRASFGLQ